MANKTRVEKVFRHTKPTKDGGFSPHLNKEISQRIARYCKIKNLNKTAFVIDCVNAQLDMLEKDMFNGVSKTYLIELLKQSWEES